MNTDEFFAEAKRLNLRILGTPDETRAALDLKDAEIANLRAAVTALLKCPSGEYCDAYPAAHKLAQDAMRYTE